MKKLYFSLILIGLSFLFSGCSIKHANSDENCTSRCYERTNYCSTCTTVCKINETAVCIPGKVTWMLNSPTCARHPDCYCK